MDINECVQLHIGDQIGCQLPWMTQFNDSMLPACQSESQYKKYLTRFAQLTSLTENSVAKMTGCKPKCNRFEYVGEVITMGNWPNTSFDSLAGYYYYPSGKYTQKTYYYVYTWGTMLADVGGYLGLLLGHSLLGFYDMGKGMLKK